MEPTDQLSTKKRKNRWGTVEEYNPSSDLTQGDGEGTGETQKVRKSRWTDMTVPTPPIVPNNLLQSPNTTGFLHVDSVSQETAQQILILKIQLQQVNDRLLNVVRDAQSLEQDPNRSPSPPPKYDSNGKRTNTREVRMRDTLAKERSRIFEEMMRLNPQFQGPSDFLKTKPVKKIYIPKQENPLYNFIGLIIGPRGNTQKQMEQETGCKISIRGKGSSKEGSKGRSNRNTDDDDELHVHISGETEENVNKASKMVEELLKPIDDEVNEHKQKQLRELALINGTLREDEYCPVCGEKGHRQFECPHRAKSFKAANVKCSICGDLSHPTRDCPLKQDTPSNQVTLDSEYDSFMAELDGGYGAKVGARPSSTVVPNVSLLPKAISQKQDNTTVSSAPDPSGSDALTRVAPVRVPVILAPIVNTVTKKTQTIIHVKTLMTGNAPPVLLSSSDEGQAREPGGHSSSNCENVESSFHNIVNGNIDSNNGVVHPPPPPPPLPPPLQPHQHGLLPYGTQEQPPFTQRGQYQHNSYGGIQHTLSAYPAQMPIVMHHTSSLQAPPPPPPPSAPHHPQF